MIRLTVMVLWLALVAACGERAEQGTSEPNTAQPAAPAPEPQESDAPAKPEFRQAERPSVTPQASEIDWSTARSDLAKAGNGSAGSVRVQSGSNAPPVPVLLPSGQTASVQAAGGETPALRQLADGYYATYPGRDYDISVSGTNQVYGEAAEGETGEAELVFLPTVSGAQVSLKRYGASYLVEFECKGQAGAQGAACIDEAEALEVARNLVIAGSR